MKKLSLLVAFVIAGFGFSKADEGMWLPSLIQGQTYEEMVKLGIKLTPEQIFDVNKSSIKDAVVRLGRGFCSGEIISDQGLMLTNHHCGFDAIQKLSSAASESTNYLKNGFWAKTKKDEMYASFSVSFLQEIVDVTAEVYMELSESMSYEDRMKKVAEAQKKLVEEYTDKTSYISADFKSFFEGNKYYIFIYKTFPDVRLVGTPPQSLGKYGGETDNWMWPRHTCDFSMFRVYANKDNEPAEYSTDNVPYKPKHHFPVSLKGFEEGDFAMIFGYPGSTDRYLTSYGVKNATDSEFPARVEARRIKLDIYEKYMAMNETNKLAYASKYAGVSNYWKNFMGQTRGLKRLNIADRKAEEEARFEQWVKADKDRTAMYGDVIDMYKQGYEIQNKYRLSYVYLTEAIFGIESFSYAYGFNALQGLSGDELKTVASEMAEESNEYFKDYIRDLDLEVCAAMLQQFYEKIPLDQQPADFVKLVVKYKKNFNNLAAALFKKSMFDDADKVSAFLQSPNMKKLEKDPIYKLMGQFIQNYRGNIAPHFMEANEKLAKAKRLYVKGLMEMNADKAYTSDANSTMRLTYGSIKDYYPADAVFYNYFTTMDGVMEKYVPGDLEFDLPQRFVELAKAKKYGQYADKDGELHVCFLSNNDITGGNSGSPVINAEGHLIGTAFDGNWEAMSGDIAFEPELQRTISLDVRYTLWVIDVFAGAGHLVEEMTIIK
ncbi:MAG: S46 family peptidase [Bacteroidia bacterium]